MVAERAGDRAAAGGDGEGHGDAGDGVAAGVGHLHARHDRDRGAGDGRLVVAGVQGDPHGRAGGPGRGEGHRRAGDAGAGRRQGVRARASSRASSSPPSATPSASGDVGGAGDGAAAGGTAKVTVRPETGLPLPSTMRTLGAGVDGRAGDRRSGRLPPLMRHRVARCSADVDAFTDGRARRDERGAGRGHDADGGGEHGQHQEELQPAAERTAAAASRRAASLRHPRDLQGQSHAGPLQGAVGWARQGTTA